MRVRYRVGVHVVTGPTGRQKAAWGVDDVIDGTALARGLDGLDEAFGAVKDAGGGYLEVEGRAWTVPGRVPDGQLALFGRSGGIAS